MDNKDKTKNVDAIVNCLKRVYGTYENALKTVVDAVVEIVDDRLDEYIYDELEEPDDFDDVISEFKESYSAMVGKELENLKERIVKYFKPVSGNEELAYYNIAPYFRENCEELDWENVENLAENEAYEIAIEIVPLVKYLFKLYRYKKRALARILGR